MILVFNITLRELINQDLNQFESNVIYHNDLYV